MLLAGRYRVDNELPGDQGATICAGWDTRFDRPVIIKFVDRPVDAATDPRLIREARVLGSSSHPGLVRVFDLVQEHDPPFVVLESVSGEPLSQWLKRRQIPPLAQWAHWTQLLFGALGEVHRQGFLLRSVLPETVFISANTLKMIGLGQGRHGDNPADSVVTGSLLSPYFAPELLKDGQNPDPRSDLYSVAALSFRMLTGEDPVPLGKIGAGDAIMRIMTARATRAGDVRGDVPDAISAFFERALAKDPKQRLASAADHLRAIHKALESADARTTEPPPADWLPRIGEELDGYVVRSLLGRGGMGAVLLARDLTLERNVAIKLLDETHEGRDNAAVHEARSMASVTHPNVVQVYSVGTWKGHPYIAMEFVPGQTLRQALNETDRPELTRVASVIEQIATGLEAIHFAGLVHGDIKPSNVLLGPAGRVCVSDLGLVMKASAFDDMDRENVRGTPQYIAPERITGETSRILANRSDVYSLAIVAYEMLAGRPPFLQPDAKATLRDQIDTPPRPLSEYRTDLPAKVEACIMRGLHKDPRQRTESAKAFRDELLRALEGSETKGETDRVLIVDDDPDFCDLLTAVLRAELNPSVIDVVHRGADALTAAGNVNYDVVLLDLSLPDINAVEVAAAMTTDLREPPPILVITGQGTPADWQVLSALGVKGFHLKPVVPAALIAHIRHIVAG